MEVQNANFGRRGAFYPELEVGSPSNMAEDSFMPMVSPVRRSRLSVFALPSAKPNNDKLLKKLTRDFKLPGDIGKAISFHIDKMPNRSCPCKIACNTRLFTILYTFIIIVSIFGDDLRRICLPKKYDLAVDLPLTFVMMLFIIEILYNCVSKRREYIQSLEMIFDVLATLSILLDLTFFYEPLLAPLEK